MTIKTQLYMMRKRISDDDLIKIQSIITNEIERRTKNDKQNEVK